MPGLYASATNCKITNSSKSENIELFQAIIEGEKAAARLVEGNMAYVVHVAESFIVEYPQWAFLRDDFHSVGFLKITEIARTRSRNTVPQESYYPNALLSVSLRNAFTSLIRKERRYERLTPEMEAELENQTYDNVAFDDLQIDLLDLAPEGIAKQMVKLRLEGTPWWLLRRILGLTRRQQSILRTRLKRLIAVSNSDVPSSRSAEQREEAIQKRLDEVRVRRQKHWLSFKKPRV